MPTEYLDTKHQYLISALEAAYDVPQALILAHWRRSEAALEEDGHFFQKLSATELERVLSMDERTISRHLKDMEGRELLIQNDEQPKLYRLGEVDGGLSFTR